MARGAQGKGGWLRRLFRRPSRLALRIYAIGLVQFMVVAFVMELNHRSREAEHRAQMNEQFGGRPPFHGEPPPFGPPFGREPPRLGDGPPFGGPPFGGPPPGEGRPGRPPGPPPPPPFALFVGVILIVVGVSSWLTARSIARPLASLSKATRAFGEGALDARSNLKRQDEIGELAESFDDMADRITKLLLAERELLANVSHELRTPLARIRVALDLASEADPRTAVESFADIAQDLAELERIVDDVLASARLALDAGAHSARGDGPKLPVRAEQVDTHALLERSVARFRTAHPDRTLVVDLPDTLATLGADPVLLRRVFDNLLDNAHKYTERRDGAITLTARDDADHVIVDVVDEGIGISAEDQARLFEPFFRADRSRTRGTGGLGLGLALARRVVEAHGGTLTLTSELGKGTHARVRLPVVA